MVPPATFTSYYGRPVVKPSPWHADIPAYLFLGGLAGASSMLGAGADLTGRPALRRTARIGALGAITVSFAALVHDLGRPERFVNMLRVAKPTSPMSVGTWLLTAYAPLAGVAAVDEMAGIAPTLLRRLARPFRPLGTPAGLAAAAVGAGVASCTAVLLADTATPTWHAAHRELPFVFVSSAATAAGGLGMIGAPVEEAGPARLFAAGGAIAELVMERRMDDVMGMIAEPLHAGRAGQLLRASRALTAVGALGAVTIGRRSRAAACLSGMALLAGSACTRFGIFEGGQVSATDPRYTIVPQRQRLAARAMAR
ncbi:MAG TPA: NrfD/PsrC family molybdoenzyme membrane anchor subunit [Candidatus Dormibacteraeota bacterium]